MQSTDHVAQDINVRLAPADRVCGALNCRSAAQLVLEDLPEPRYRQLTLCIDCATDYISRFTKPPQGSRRRSSPEGEREPEATAGATARERARAAGRERRRAERAVPSILYTAPSRGQDPQETERERLKRKIRAQKGGSI